MTYKSVPSTKIDFFAVPHIYSLFLIIYTQGFCDLETNSAFGTRGPQRLSTEDQPNPTAGPVHEETALFQVRGVTVSSTIVFIVDNVTVIFTGTEMGEVRKVKRMCNL